MLNKANFAVISRTGKYFRICNKEMYNQGYIAEHIRLGYTKDYDHNPNKWEIRFDGNGYFVVCDTFRQAIVYLTKHYARPNKGVFI